MLGCISPCYKGNIIMEKNTIVVNHKTRCKDTPAHIKGEENNTPAFSTTFDFSNCTDAEILDLAAKTCIINFRTSCKVNDITKDEFQALMNDPIDVHEELKTVKRGLSKVQKAEKIASEMSDAEVTALLELLNNKRA